MSRKETIMPPRRPGGFTLVELLATIAIIGLLMGLLVPAVQSAREAARRMTCGNTLRQWGLAMQAYDQSYGVLPLGVSAFPCNKHTWIPVLWPFIEQVPLASRFNYLEHDDSWPNVTAPTANPIGPMSQRLPIYYCPSDRPGASFRLSPSNFDTHPRVNYVVNATAVPVTGQPQRLVGPFVRRYAGGYTLCSTGTTYVDFDARGFTGPGARRLAGVRDGISNTLLLSETNVWPSDEDLPPVDPRGIPFFFGWFDARLTPNSAFDIVDAWFKPPNYNCRNSPPYLPCQATGNNDWLLAARSKHPGGIQAAMCDGAVRFVSEFVDQAAWQAQGTMNGREVPLPVE